MPITVSMIEEKEFKTKVRGYDPVEVDEFLDEICDEFVAMQEEIASLQSRLAQAQSDAAQPRPAFAPAAVPPVAPAPAPAPAPMTDGAQKLLAKAQQVYDETVAEAKEKAQTLLDDAKAKADERLSGLEAEHEKLIEKIAELRASAKDYRDRLQLLLEEQKRVLDADQELFDEQ